MNIVQEFEKVRDIPYRIPLSIGEKDECCTGKAKMLLDVLHQHGYEARYRIGTFHWSSLNLPEKINNVPHDDESSHTFVEVKINGEWKVVDPTWDRGVGKILPANMWDGKSDTSLAVPVDNIFSPEEGIKYMNHISTPEAVGKDLEINGKFYRAFNEWLASIRKERTL